MKYAVIGPGAIGSIIYYILEDKRDAILITKPYQLKILKEKGLKIKEFNKTVRTIRNVNVTSSFPKLKEVDVIFLCVKSTDTREVAEKIKGNVKKSALIISLQNGVRNTDILSKITGITSIPGVVTFNATLNEIGEVLLTMKGNIYLQNNKEFEYILNDIREIFNSSSIKIKLVDDITSLAWSKLVINLQNAITAITGQTIRQSLIDPISRKIIYHTLEEGIKVVEKKGVKLGFSFVLNPKLLLFLLRLPTFFIRFGVRLMRIESDAKSSMLQSILRGKQTEVEFLNGEIDKLARNMGLRAPINKKLVQIIKEMEKRKKIKFMSPLELAVALGIN